MTDLRTFADKKGAMKAIKRDAAALPEQVILLDLTAHESTEVPGRFYATAHLDHLDTEVLDLTALAGFNVSFEGLPVAPVKPAKKRKSGEVNVNPLKTLLAARSTSKQQAMIDLLAAGCVWDQPHYITEEGPDGLVATLIGYSSLAGGCKMEDLRKVCVKSDGTTWEDGSIRSALYYDVRQKGYGILTIYEGDDAWYSLILPVGCNAPLPPRVVKS